MYTRKKKSPLRTKCPLCGARRGEYCKSVKKGTRIEKFTHAERRGAVGLQGREVRRDHLQNITPGSRLHLAVPVAVAGKRFAPDTPVTFIRPARVGKCAGLVAEVQRKLVSLTRQQVKY